MDRFWLRYMNRWLLAPWLLATWMLAGMPAAVWGQTPAVEARRLATEALEAMGGVAKWRGLESLRLATIGHSYWLEQSERPEGPWIVGYEQVSFAFDYIGGRVRRTTSARNILTPEWNTSVVRLDGKAAAIEVGDRLLPAPPVLAAELREIRAVQPHSALLRALDATDLRLETDSVVQGVDHRVISYDSGDSPIRIFLNRHTSLPTAVQVLQPDFTVQSVAWGDAARTYYSLWSLEPGGYLLPRQWDVEDLGVVRATVTVTSMELGPEFHPDSLRIPDSVASMPSPFAGSTFRELQPGMQRGRPVPPIEVATGLVVLPGAWNITLVEQPDGVVVLEAPVSAGYSRLVIGEAERRFPDVPIKAVVSTSDAWLHVSGLREYVARGIPVYALDLNVSMLKRLASAEHHRIPDLQTRRQREPLLRAVSTTTQVGSGPNRLVLHPVRGEAGERMMAAYFPDHRLLYASDLVQKRSDGTFFWPAYLLEIERLVSQHSLVVDRVFAFHTEPTPWTEVTGALEQVRRSASGEGG